MGNQNTALITEKLINIADDGSFQIDMSFSIMRLV